MSLTAQQLFDTAPLGALVAFGDGSPRPPDRFHRKLCDWSHRNASGRLICKMPGDPQRGRPDAFTLHMGAHRSDGVVVLIIQRTMDVRSTLSFEVTDTPRTGEILCLVPFGEELELRHVAVDQPDAAAWLSRNRYSRALFHEVLPDGGTRAIFLPDSLVA